MIRLNVVAALSVVLLSVVSATAQTSAVGQLAELVALNDKVGNADTRVRVDALHRVWSIAFASSDSEVKVVAIGLLALVYVLCLFGFIIGIGLAISWAFFGGVKPPVG